ncbi:sensor histidine kinase [Streptomyces spiralis]
MAARLRNGSPATDITVACPPGLTATVCEDRLDRAVTDRICNAQQHGHGPIEVTAEPDDGQIRVQVRDRGPGFPPGSLPHAFDRFTWADAARTTTGTGLGPAITAAIARSAGATTGQPTTPTAAPSYGSPSRPHRCDSSTPSRTSTLVRLFRFDGAGPELSAPGETRARHSSGIRPPTGSRGGS